MAMPATASTPMLSSQSMSSWVVTPPAAVTSRVVASTNGGDRLAVDALHQPLDVDVGEEELAEERLEQRGSPRPA